MGGQTVYLKCLRSAKVSELNVYLSDICSLRCANAKTAAKLKAIIVWRFDPKKQKRHVVSTLRLVELMEEKCPGITVEIIGETEVLIEYVVNANMPIVLRVAKILLVCFVSFLGTAFTIMAYHNDIGINAIFGEMYRIVLNEKPQGFNALELAYSLGVTIGMLLFFNHAGGGTITEDPTPIQVAMRTYEKDVDGALMETAQRTGEEEENKK